MLMLVTSFSLTFVSCGGDDNEEPDNPSNGIVTNYGTVKPTGVQTMSIFISAKDGETVLNLYGFAPIRAQGSYNVYTRVIDSIYLYAEGDNEFASWTPGDKIPSNFRDTENASHMLVRTKIKGSEEYVYAYIEKIRSLAEATGEMKKSLMGYVIKYQSPIDPATFNGFE